MLASPSIARQQQQRWRLLVTSLAVFAWACSKAVAEQGQQQQQQAVQADIRRCSSLELAAGSRACLFGGWSDTDDEAARPPPHPSSSSGAVEEDPQFAMVTQFPALNRRQQTTNGGSATSTSISIPQTAANGCVVVELGSDDGGAQCGVCNRGRSPFADSAMRA